MRKPSLGPQPSASANSAIPAGGYFNPATFLVYCFTVRRQAVVGQATRILFIGGTRTFFVASYPRAFDDHYGSV